MQTRSRNTFTTIHTEGSLLPADLLQRILSGDKDLGGLTPTDYHLPGNEKLNEAVNHSWNRLQGAWAAFQTSKSRLKEGDPGTTLTRERWLLPLFQELGYGRLVTAKAIEIEGKSYAISHTWGSAELPTPIHLVGCGVDIEKRQVGVSGASKSSPHSLMQELLNRDEPRHWGLVSNGLRLRVLRDNASLTRQAFVEFDLEAMFSGEIYADFAVLWLVCHQSRLEGDKPEAQWLERWSQVAQDQGTRALEGLRSGVEDAIVALGQGFLSHPANQALRQQLKSGKLDRQQYFRQLLRLVYRLIFLFVAEDRDLLLLQEAASKAKKRYLKYYSTARLRRLAERQRGGRHPDLWQGLKLLTDLLAGNIPGGREIGLPVLGGFLFSHKALPDLEAAQVDNQALLNAVRSLAFTQEKNSRRAVDYKNLGSEELGSVYESLLELQPILNVEAGTFQLSTAAGNERKTSGSYYTNAGLIKITLDSALDPVIDQAIERAGNSIEMQIAALLALKVCDPASGSGHFLIAAARRIARRLAQLRSGDEEPSPSTIRHALREVIAHCIYGVDINPMAVELCKVNLWLEALEPGKPLTFLDAHIKCGNSLVGVGPGMDVYDLTIPDEAFDPVTGDDKKVASALKKRNKAERQGQLTFDLHGLREEPVEDYAARLRQVEAMPEDNTEQVAAKEAAYIGLQSDYQAQHRRLLADLWTAAFFWRLQPDPNGALAAPTQGEWRNACLGKPSLGLAAEASRLSDEINFFHWPLEFPDVFDQGGFDCMLGNPPWERVQPEAIQFFSINHPELLEMNRSAREIAIKKLEIEDPTIHNEWLETRRHELASTKFLKHSGRFPLSTSKNINSYAVFHELALSITAISGQSGLILQSGIATDDINKDLFQKIVNENMLIEFYDFENRIGLFADVHRSMRFCLITCKSSISKIKDTPITFAYNCFNVSDIHSKLKIFYLTAKDLNVISPNTGLCPAFRTRIDAELVVRIYKKLGVFVRETGEEKINPWNATIRRIFSISYDSDIYQNYEDAYKAPDKWVPVYEAKYFHQFDHRFNSDNEDSAYSDKGFNSYITPRYWAPKDEVVRRIPPVEWQRDYLLGYRDITNATNERTCIASLLPYTATSDTIRVVFPQKHSVKLHACLLANFNSIVFDYVARNVVASTHLSEYIMKQLPVLPPSAYTPTDIDFIAPQVLELVYTAYDLRPFAEDMGYHGEPFRWDEERRALLRAKLDAYYARLYGLTRDELRYILDPQDVYGSDFPGETFRVLKEKEIRQFGEYRTRRLVLEAWDRLDSEGWKVEGLKVESARSSETLPAVSSEPVIVVEKPGTAQAVVAEDQPKLEEQPAFADFGMYKCELCGKMVIGYDRENHAQEAHKNEVAVWVKVK